MLNRKRLGRDIFMRGSKSGVKSIYDKKVSLTLFELLKAYSGIVMTKDFHTMNIPKLPVFTTEDAIKRIKEFFGNLNEWKNISELVPSGFKNSPNLKKTGKAGIFAGSLELVKEGNVSLKQKELFDDIFIIIKISSNNSFCFNDTLPSLTNSNDPANIPALPVFFKLGEFLKPDGTNSEIFFHSLRFPKNSLILLMASSVVKTGSLGIFIV